jgi:hypothetical protein
MSSTASHDAGGKGSRQDVRQESWLGFWLSIARICVLEIVLLVALSGAFIAYLNWSSDATFAEFVSAGVAPAPSNSIPPSSTHAARADATRAHATCDRGS